MYGEGSRDVAPGVDKLVEVERDAAGPLRVERAERAHAALQEEAQPDVLIEAERAAVVWVVALEHGLHDRRVHVEAGVSKRVDGLAERERTRAVGVKVVERGRHAVEELRKNTRRGRAGGDAVGVTELARVRG